MTLSFPEWFRLRSHKPAGRRDVERERLITSSRQPTRVGIGSDRAIPSEPVPGVATGNGSQGPVGDGRYLDMPAFMFGNIVGRLHPRDQLVASRLFLARKDRAARIDALDALPQTQTVAFLRARFTPGTQPSPAIERALPPADPERRRLFEHFVPAALVRGAVRSDAFRTQLRAIPWRHGVQQSVYDEFATRTAHEPELHLPLARTIDVLEPEQRERCVRDLRQRATNREQYVAAADALRTLPDAAFSHELDAFLAVATERPADRTAIHRACATALLSRTHTDLLETRDVDALLDSVTDTDALALIGRVLSGLASESDAFAHRRVRLRGMTDAPTVRRELASGLHVHPTGNRLQELRALCAPGDPETCAILAKKLRHAGLPASDRIAACDALIDATHDPAVLVAIVRDFDHWPPSYDRAVVDPERRRLLTRIRTRSLDPSVATALVGALRHFSKDELIAEFAALRTTADLETARSLVGAVRMLPPYLQPIEFRRLRELAMERGDRKSLEDMEYQTLESCLAPLHAMPDRAAEHDAVRAALA